MMAQHLMRHIAGEAINAISAGTHAKIGGQANPVSAQALAECGIDVSAHRPTQLDDTLLAAADLIVVLGAQARIEEITPEFVVKSVPVTAPNDSQIREADSSDRRSGTGCTLVG